MNIGNEWCSGTLVLPGEISDIGENCYGECLGKHSCLLNNHVLILDQLLLHDEHEPLLQPAQPPPFPPATILVPLWAKKTDIAR